MNRFLQSIGLIATLVALIYGVNYLYTSFQDISSLVLQIVGGITLIVVSVYLVLRISLGQNWAIKFGTQVYFGSGLIDSTKKLITEIEEKKISKDTLAEVVAHIVWRITRIGMVGLLIAGLPIWLLMQQNSLIKSQNKLFDYQNSKVTTQTLLDSVQTILAQQQTELLKSQDSSFKRQNQLLFDQNENISAQTVLFEDQNFLVRFQNTRIDSQISLMSFQNSLIDTQNYRLNLQNNLIEADRRSSLVFLMSNLLDKMDDEIKEQRKQLTLSPQDDSTQFYLSDPLIGRIIALSRAFKPYKILEGDTLQNKLVSPERGQLFIALMESNINSTTQRKIFPNANFEYAIIGRINLRFADLRFADLRLADLSGAVLGAADLSGAILSGAVLIDAVLIDAHLNVADLRSVDLSGADLRGVELIGADLDGAKLGHADLSFADLRGADLGDADLNGADLRGVDLSDAVLRGAKLNGADLSGAWGITTEQLSKSSSLYNSKGIESMKDSLIKIRPKIFEKPYWMK